MEDFFFLRYLAIDDNLQTSGIKYDPEIRTDMIMNFVKSINGKIRLRR